ncbi:MAG: hypothetical protein ACRDKJ_13190 [Actinomycetota bacterium]
MLRRSVVTLVAAAGLLVGLGAPARAIDPFVQCVRAPCGPIIVCVTEPCPSPGIPQLPDLPVLPPR